MSLERVLELMKDEVTGVTCVQANNHAGFGRNTGNQSEVTGVTTTRPSVTPATPRNPAEVTENSSRINDVTPVTPVTPKKTEFERESQVRQPDRDGGSPAPDGRDGLIDALEVVCKDLPVTPGFVLSALSREDKEDWHRGEIPDATLEAFAKALFEERERDQGRRPSDYTERAVCRQCGPVWHWRKGAFGSCIWCRNRINDNPIPRPPVACRECRHWSPDRINPPGGLGSCAIRAPASKRAGACWPGSEVACPEWRSR